MNGGLSASSPWSLLSSGAIPRGIDPRGGEVGSQRISLQGSRASMERQLGLLDKLATKLEHAI